MFRYLLHCLGRGVDYVLSSSALALFSYSICLLGALSWLIIVVVDLVSLVQYFAELGTPLWNIRVWDGTLLLLKNNLHRHFWLWLAGLASLLVLFKTMQMNSRYQRERLAESCSGWEGLDDESLFTVTYFGIAALILFGTLIWFVNILVCYQIIRLIDPLEGIPWIDVLAIEAEPVLARICLATALFRLGCWQRFKELATVRKWYCAKCGYNLHGLNSTTPCPECGQLPQ